MTTHFSLRDFVLEGVLGGARAGMTRGEIRGVLGDPDQWAGDEPEASGIWRFGLFEVHFGEDGRAWMLYRDYLGDLDPGPGRTVDPWFLDGSAASRTLAVVVAHLGREGTRFHRGTVLGNDLVIRLAHGVDLDFDGTSDDARWSAISAVAEWFVRRLRAVEVA